MKKLVLFILALVPVGQTWAQHFRCGDLLYNFTSDTTVEVTYQYPNLNNYSELTTITIPETINYEGVIYTVTAIGNSAFQFCQQLELVDIPNTVTQIGSCAFIGCGNLNSIAIGTSVAYIGNDAFSSCNKLETLTFNSNDIGTYFRNCKTLKTINIGDSVTEIAKFAFSGCTELVTITIGNSDTKIGHNAFYNCNKIEYYEDLYAYYIGNDENPYSILMKAKSNNALFEINDNCKGIYNNAIEGRGLTDVIIPNSVVWIGDQAFSYCEKLTSVNIPNSVIEIGENAFKSCKVLKDVIIGNSVTSIGMEAFSNCYGLSSVIIGSSVSSIGENAFKYCSHINPILCFGTIPAELVGDPFPSSDTVYVPSESVEAYKSSAFWGSKEILPFGIVSVKSGNETQGTVLGDSILLYDSSITITAIPKEGYHFAKWSDNNTDNPRSYSKVNDTSFTAIFEAHNVVIDEAVAATCTTRGLTEGSHCSICGEILVAQNETPMAEHAAVVDAAVAATATTDGLTEGSHCSVCGAILVAQVVIPALGEQGGNENQGGNNNNPATAVSESAASAVNIYAIGSSIVVENATEEIRVYNAMGGLVATSNEVNAKIGINGSGVYIVKVGSVVKRVVVK